MPKSRKKVATDVTQTLYRHAQFVLVLKILLLGSQLFGSQEREGNSGILMQPLHADADERGCSSLCTSSRGVHH